MKDVLRREIGSFSANALKYMGILIGVYEVTKLVSTGEPMDLLNLYLGGTIYYGGNRSNEEIQNLEIGERIRESQNKLEEKLDEIQEGGSR